MSVGLCRLRLPEPSYPDWFAASLGLTERADILPIVDKLCGEAAKLRTWANTNAAMASVKIFAHDLVHTVTASTLHFSDHLAWLEERGFSREQQRQIRYVVESFYIAEPIALAATRCIISQLCGERTIPVTGCVRLQPLYVLPAGTIERVELPDNHPLGTRWRGTVPAFFKALSMWPDYFDLVWSELSGQLESAEYIEAVSSVISRLNTFDRNTVRGYRRPPTGPALKCVRRLERFAESSCEVIVIVGGLRRMFTRAEVAARRRRWREPGADG